MRFQLGSLHLLFIWVLASCSIHLVQGQALCALSKTFCFYSQKVTPLSDANAPKGDVVQFRLETTKKVGFVAVGLGSGMSDAEVFVVWGNPDGTVTVSRRASKGYEEPAVVSNQDLFVVKSATSYNLTSGVLIATFQRTVTPSSAGGVEKSISSGSQSLIWAIGPQPSSSAPNARLSQHAGSNRGVLSASLLANSSAFTEGQVPRPGSDAPTNNDYELRLKAHGIMMAIAWCVMAPLGILVARFLKGVLGVWWFRIHMAVMLLGVYGLHTAGFALIVSAVEGPHFSINKYASTNKNVGGAHVIIGLIIMILSSIQVISGFVIDWLFDSKRTAVPWWDKMHWWIGRLGTLGAIANIPLGLILYSALRQEDISALPWVLYAGSLAIFFAIFVFLHFKYGHSHHVDPEGVKVPVPGETEYQNVASSSGA